MGLNAMFSVRRMSASYVDNVVSSLKVFFHHFGTNLENTSFVRCKPKYNEHFCTCETSIELSSHGDVSVPSPRMNPDVTTSNRRIKWVVDHTVTVSISGEVLLKD